MNNDSQQYISDAFLAADPDCPVFGLNLACAYPFPNAAAESYNALANDLTKLDEGVYVYPLWETHITIMTFVNFSLHQRPSSGQLNELQTLVGPLTSLFKVLFDSIAIAPFSLELGQPVLSPKAAILPITNPSGEITRIRRRACELLEGDKELKGKLLRAGLNIPGIIHSTIMRFKKSPRDAASFAASFDAAAKRMKPFAITVEEIFLTTETKPYMREGAIAHRFPLVSR